MGEIPSRKLHADQYTGDWFILACEHLYVKTCVLPRVTPMSLFSLVSPPDVLTPGTLTGEIVDVNLARSISILLLV